MIRRFTNGQFRMKPPLADVPLFAAAFRAAKSQRHCEAWTVRRQRSLEKALAHCAIIRGSLPSVPF